MSTAPSTTQALGTSSSGRKAQSSRANSSAMRSSAPRRSAETRKATSGVALPASIRPLAASRPYACSHNSAIQSGYERSSAAPVIVSSGSASSHSVPPSATRRSRALTSPAPPLPRRFVARSTAVETAACGGMRSSSSNWYAPRRTMQRVVGSSLAGSRSARASTHASSSRWALTVPLVSCEARPRSRGSSRARAASAVKARSTQASSFS